jgi:hypothetical protein
MTDLLVRSDTAAPRPDRAAAPPPAFTLGTAARWTVAALAAGAGVIHLAMVPSHWSGSAWEGFAFAVCGWLQLALAVLVLVRPTRVLLGAGVVLNAAAIAAWAVSRTVGLPLSAHSGAEEAGFVDITTVVLEGLLVVVLLAFLFAPRARAARGKATFVVTAIVVVGVLSMTTAALASPGAVNHSHADNVIGGGHTHGLPNGVTAGDDKGFSLLHNGQHEHTTMVHQLDKPTQALLDHQLAVTRQVAAKTPTVTDALKAGYMRVGPYFPGIGAHYMKKIGPDGSGFTPLTMNLDGLIDDTDLNNPLMLIFDGTKPTSKIAGFMYYSFAPTEPAGFAGRNDTWHLHENLCLKFTKDAIDVPYGLDNSASEAECKAAGAMMIKLSNYMVHVWSVPGYEMPDGYGGVFGEENPKLKCADGTYYMLPKTEWAAHPLDACKSQ